MGIIQLGIGLDYGIYQDRAAGFVAGNGFYLPRQLTGPYDLQNGDSLYPPPALLLFIPFLYLPALLWWAIPLGIILGIVVYHRPTMWVWPLVALCTIAGNGFASIIQKGNPTMWVGAAIPLATLWRPAAVLVLLKPSLFPFAFFGANRRSWWLALAVVGLISLAFLPMWLDYFSVVSDARGRDWRYSASEVPFLLIPLIAWVGRTRVRVATSVVPNRDSDDVVTSRPDH